MAEIVAVGVALAGSVGVGEVVPVPGVAGVSAVSVPVAVAVAVTVVVAVVVPSGVGEAPGMPGVPPVAGGVPHTRCDADQSVIRFGLHLRDPLVRFRDKRKGVVIRLLGDPLRLMDPVDRFGRLVVGGGFTG